MPAPRKEYAKVGIDDLDYTEEYLSRNDQRAGDEDIDGDIEDRDGKKVMACVVWVLLAVILLAAFDSVTTHLLKQFFEDLTYWTARNAPASFFIYHLVVFIFFISW